jgi:tetratricopeptide (TPR) repeat protein
VPGEPKKPETGAPFGPRYLLLERIGKGGMGEVWKARDRELDQLVALKMIRADLLEGPGILERFKQEITLARKVTHKNVTRIHDLGVVERTRFISMEFLEGVDLKKFIKEEGALPEEKAIPIILGICEGLKAAHDAGIVHRDLKPQNVLIDPEGSPHIMDFGIASSRDSAGMTGTGDLLGTPEYMSPEQVRGEKVDLRSDIYSMGLIMYEMVTGDLPFSSDSVASSMYKRLSERPRRPRELQKDLSPFLDKIVLKCLEKDRAFRYGNIGELIADIESQHAPMIAASRLASLFRSKVTIAGAVGVVAALAAVAVISLFRVIGPAGPAPVVTVPSIAFLPFENRTGDPMLDWTRTGLPMLITEGLIGTSDLRLLNGERTQQTLDDLDLALTGVYTPFDLKRAASVLGADHVVTGAVRRDGDRLIAEGRVHGDDEQENMAIGPVEAEGDAAIYALSEELTSDIITELDLEPHEQPGLREATTGSLEALRFYSEGLELERGGQHLEAVKRLEQAVLVDSSFALAHVQLSRIFDRLGRRDRALSSSRLAVENLGETAGYRARLIRARHAVLEGRLDEAIAEYAGFIESYPQDADAHLELAGVLEQNGDLEGAASELETCIAIDPNHATARFELGWIRESLGEAEVSMKIFSELLGFYTQSNNDPGRGKVLNALGNVQLQLGRYDEALDYYRQSLEIARRVEDRRSIAVAMSNIANVLREQGEYDEAIPMVREALELRTQIGDRRGIAEEWTTLGEIYEDAGRFPEAQKAYQESLNIVRDLDDPAFLARMSSNVGYVSSILGNFAEAYLLYQDALAKRREVGDKAQIMRSLVELGLIEQWQGRYDKAMEYANEANEIVGEIGEALVGVVISINVGMIQDDQGSYGAAVGSLDRALEGARKLEQKYMIASALMTLGGIFVHLGDLEGARPRLTEAELLVEEMQSAALMPELLNYKAELQCMLGETAECLKTLEEARRMAESSGDLRLVILSRLNLGRWSLGAGRTSGRAHLAWAAEKSDEANLRPLKVRALTYLATAGAPDIEAVKMAEEAFSDGGPLDLRESLVATAWLLAREMTKKGEHSSAKRYYLEASRRVGEMAEGLEEPLRSALLDRPDLKRLSEEALTQIGDHGSAEERAKVAAAFGSS